MNIDDIRQISLVDFLHHLGYEPTGRDSKGLWFYRRRGRIAGKIYRRNNEYACRDALQATIFCRRTDI